TAISVGGCAAMRRHDARDTGNLLVAAGFKTKLADSPERAQQLRAMPPRSDGDLGGRLRRDAPTRREGHRKSPGSRRVQDEAGRLAGASPAAPRDAAEIGRGSRWEAAPRCADTTRGTPEISW